MTASFFEWLGGQLAPELGPTLYVFLGEDDRDLPPGGEDVLGFTAGRLDLSLRPLLAERWKGRGPAVALNLPCIRREAERFGMAFGLRTVATLVHELAHVFSDNSP